MVLVSDVQCVVGLNTSYRDIYLEYITKIYELVAEKRFLVD